MISASVIEPPPTSATAAQQENESALVELVGSDEYSGSGSWFAAY